LKLRIQVDEVQSTKDGQKVTAAKKKTEQDVEEKI
jgi:hypothetical protein